MGASCHGWVGYTAALPSTATPRIRPPITAPHSWLKGGRLQRGLLWGVGSSSPHLSSSLELPPISHAIVPPLNILFLGKEGWVGKALRHHRNHLVKDISSQFTDGGTEAQWG